MIFLVLFFFGFQFPLNISGGSGLSLGKCFIYARDLTKNKPDQFHSGYCTLESSFTPVQGLCAPRDSIKRSEAPRTTDALFTNRVLLTIL